MQSREQTPGNLWFHSSVSVCARVSFYSVCCIRLSISCLILMSLSILNVQSDSEEKKSVFTLKVDSQQSHRILLLALSNIYFRYYTMAWCCVYHTKINNLPKVEFLSQSAFGFCRMALLCMPITVRIRPYWLGIGIISLLISIKEGALSRLRL